MKIRTLVAAAALVALLAGCAHSGEIPRSPCACDFHTLPAAVAGATA